MAAAQANPIETTFEHKLARDIIRYVLRDYMIGLHWTPTGIFTETDLDSPFTPQFKDAIKEELENEGHNLHRVFDVYFPDKSLVDCKYMDVCQRLKKRFVAEIFEIKSLISFSTFMAMFAGLSYHYGSNTGEFVSYMMIVQYIRELKKLGKINDNIWREVQDWLENNPEPFRLWSTVFQ